MKGIKPLIAIVSGNSLQNIGLADLLEGIMPMAEICSFHTFEEMAASQQEFFHYFVSPQVIMQASTFFMSHCHQTIVICRQEETASIPNVFHTLDKGLNEKEFAAQLIMLQRAGHDHGKNLPEHVKESMSGSKEPQLTAREIEVLKLIAKGYINKEIASDMGVALTTIISHRKNIVQKLNIRSVSGLTIYAVMHGYVPLNSI